jgi:hypothetical protein
MDGGSGCETVHFRCIELGHTPNVKLPVVFEASKAKTETTLRVVAPLVWN